MSTATPNTLRQRGAGEGKKLDTPSSPNGLMNGDVLADKVESAKKSAKAAVTNDWDYKVALLVLTAAAFFTRFWGIGHPAQVVFDEVHFGKFASYYLQRTYFFDVHPPFGKLLFALAGWLVGYDGSFLFENIGESYITNHVPYVAYRSMPALMGSLTVTTVFCIMWESGYSLPACIVATALVLFDNAHVGQTRLILLDATLVLFMAVSVLCYVRFYKMRHAAFGRKWWKWLLLTGISLSCVISTKYVGAFTFFSIGVPVVIDLWELLNVKRSGGALSLPTFGAHLGARIFALIVVPFFMYLFWFQVHFAILTRSGPGDAFMTPEFQETLSDNLLLQQAVGIDYFDEFSMRHKETKVYLHSHLDRYPLRYEDGRVSSQGQQVTGYPHNDTNNVWQIVPSSPLEGSGHPVKNNDLIRLRHVGTDSWLLTHDVASPYYPTNQEFTTVPTSEANGDRYNDTLFELRIEYGKRKEPFKTLASHFKLVHRATKIAMWTHTTPLPEWAYKQAEINGNKNIQHSSNLWYVEDLPDVAEDSPRRLKDKRQIKPMPFMKKYLELQRAMFYHNNALKQVHPYSSAPSSWPFLLRGVSFWTDNETRRQIYFLGNPLGWWFTAAVLAVFAGIIGADQLSMRRGVDALDRRTRSRLYDSTGFFFLLWAAHYFPFFIMGRQLFLHHYLPAHLASALVTGALVEFIFNIEPADIQNLRLTDGKTGSQAQQTQRSRPIRDRIAGQNMVVTWAVSGVIIAVLIWAFWFFAPLTYGNPSLPIEGVKARRWLNYDMHFANYPDASAVPRKKG